MKKIILGLWQRNHACVSLVTGMVFSCTALAMLLSAPALSAQTMPADVDAAIRRVLPLVTDIRHDIHQHPELSNREFRTAALVEKHLRGLGLEVRTGIAHTGVVGILRGARPGPVIAVRADMDALPVTEENSLSYRSTERASYNGQQVGVMHACGHDVHTAIMLGLASVMAERRQQLAGTVMFIFQPAEEGAPSGESGGAELMLKEGVFADLKPAMMFGLHTNVDLPTGQIGYTSGPTAASSDEFAATLKGRSAHAAFPQASVDPVVMASQAVMALQTIRSRNLSPLQPSVITVAQIHGGIRNNIIPDEVRLEGTVRLYDAKARDDVERRMREVLTGIASASGGSASLDYKRGYPPLVSDAALIDRTLPSLQSALGKDNVRHVDPVMAADDFAYFSREMPSVFFFLGVVKPGTTSGNNHTPTFMADDASIAVGLRAMTAILLDQLRR